MPRYMRPGGYEPSDTQNPLRRRSFVSQLFNLDDGANRMLNAFAPVLQDIGYGLATSPDIGSAFSAAAVRGAEMQPYRQEQSEREREIDQSITQRDAAARNLVKWNPAFQPIADMVAAGHMEPQAAWKQAFEFDANEKKTALELQKARGNAAFIKDPDLREMVASGALPFKDAMEYERGGAGASGNYGDTVMLGRDANDNPVPLRAAPGGGLSQAQLPPGITFDPGGMAGARTSAQYDAKTVSAAKAALPGAEQTLNITLDAIDTLRSDQQGQAEQFGGMNRTFGATPGTAMANFQVNLEQAGGQAFMQAREMLRGGGQITDFEGRRAETAFSRLTLAAEKGDAATFNAALDDFEQAVVEGYRKLQEVAAGSYSPGPGPGGGNPGASSDDPVTRYNLEP